MELRAEIEHHDRVREAMAAMRHTTVGLLGAFERDFVEGKQNRYADDAGPDHNMGFAMARHSDERLDDLADRDNPLFFGRLWLDSGDDYHLGRRHVRDESDRSIPLVVDWRAAIAERYYRASVHQRRSVAKRRRFGFHGGTLTGFEDEDLRLGEDFASEFLTSEIERPRTGPMRDIVATIQPEQDELIRREADTTLCVQGAPGTGKTAVGLHRAAWLLYSYPGKLTRRGMLVIGPNQGFLRYIAGVLPTLGETSVWQVTVDKLTGAAEAAGPVSRDVALIKHDARMVEVCQRAIWSQVGQAEDKLMITHAGARAYLDVEQLNDAVRRARETNRTWDAGRKSLERAVVQGLTRQLEASLMRAADTKWAQDIKRKPPVKEFLDAVWPRLSAKQVLRKLYNDETFRTSVCSELLTPGETDLLARTGALKPSAADVLLLDELQAHLKPPTSTQTYGHIVVDEAQDLSPMQCRAIARRCPSGSLTVLGDLAQGTTPWAAADWQTQMRHLGRGDVEYTELTTGFRVPGVIIDLANRLLPQLGVSVSPARSLRSDGSLRFHDCDDLATGTRETVDKALVDEGIVGVIAPDSILEDLRPALPVSQRVELVPASLAKGLEFDHVIVVEPARFLPDPTERDDRLRSGLRHLYVALTRAVSHLTVVHTRPVPTQLGDISHL
ncbi:MAG: HelD family protein [Actinomycetota bacterium]